MIHRQLSEGRREQPRKMYNERIIGGSVDFSKYHSVLFCPNFGERIATRYITKMDKKQAYRFVPSAFNKRWV
jgi:hypothetical protein